MVCLANLPSKLAPAMMAAQRCRRATSRSRGRRRRPRPGRCPPERSGHSHFQDRTARARGKRQRRAPRGAFRLFLFLLLVRKEAPMSSRSRPIAPAYRAVSGQRATPPPPPSRRSAAGARQQTVLLRQEPHRTSDCQIQEAVEPQRQPSWRRPVFVSRPGLAVSPSGEGGGGQGVNLEDLSVHHHLREQELELSAPLLPSTQGFARQRRQERNQGASALPPTVPPTAAQEPRIA